MSTKPHAEYVLIQTRQSGKSEVYAADSLTEMAEFLQEVSGAKYQRGSDD